MWRRKGPRRAAAATRRFAALTALAALGPLVAGAGSSPAREAAAPFATFTTSACPQATTWRVAYLMWSSDSSGNALDRAATGQVAAAANRFAADLGTASACGLGIEVALFDMGAAPYPARAYSSRVPPPHHAALVRRGYDAVFHRRPRRSAQEAFGLAYVGDPSRMFVEFPVAAGPPRPGAAPGPHEGLVLHEFLHLVEKWHVPTFGFPGAGSGVSPTHYGCELEPYASDRACLVGLRYFSDLLQGRVVDRDGRRRGYAPGDFARTGTPRRPARPASRAAPAGRSTGFTIAVDPASQSARALRRTRRLRVAVTPPGPGRLTLRLSHGGRRVRTETRRLTHGRALTVSLRLTRRAQRVVRAGRTLRLSVTHTRTDGARRTLPLTMRITR